VNVQSPPRAVPLSADEAVIARDAPVLLDRLELRWRLSLAIGLLLTAALAVAALVAVHSARVAVAREVDTSLESAQASLALTLSLLQGRDEASSERALRAWVGGYRGARHLCVALEVVGSASREPQPCRRASSDEVPAWFARDVENDEPALRRELTLPESGTRLRVHLRPDPGDELREAWDDVRSFLLLIAGLAFAVNLCAFMTISYGLRPLQALVRRMDRIGRGQETAPDEDVGRRGAPEVQVLSQGLTELAQRVSQARAQVRALHIRNLELQEEERGMVARELHDEIGQHVTAIEMEAIRIGRLAPQEQAQREARLQQLRDSITRIHHVSRRLVQRLRPPSIDRLGLVGALEGLFDRWREDHPEVELVGQIDPSCDRVCNEPAVHLFRIVQECLSNVARHAPPVRTVRIRVAIAGGSVSVDVMDDGRGFDVDARMRGYGLAGMRERAEALSGTLIVSSRIGSGTLVRAEFPASPPPT
jgi:two-component system sensor histidine kinase UhpB